MTIIKKEKLNILQADEGKLLKLIEDNGKILEDDTFLEPYKTDLVYVNTNIDTLEKAQKIYEEVDI